MEDRAALVVPRLCPSAADCQQITLPLKPCGRRSHRQLWRPYTFTFNGSGVRPYFRIWRWERCRWKLRLSVCSIVCDGRYEKHQSAGPRPGVAHPEERHPVSGLPAGGMSNRRTATSTRPASPTCSPPIRNGAPVGSTEAAEEILLHLGPETEVAGVGVLGIGIWILTAATQDEYDKLFKLPNWRAYWKESWGRFRPKRTSTGCSTS